MLEKPLDPSWFALMNRFGFGLNVPVFALVLTANQTLILQALSHHE
jgi:hypothetical protein